MWGGAIDLVVFIVEGVQSRRIDERSFNRLHALSQFGAGLLSSWRKRPRTVEVLGRHQSAWASLALRVLSEGSLVADSPAMWLTLLNTLKTTLGFVSLHGSLGNTIGVICAVLRNVLRNVLEREEAEGASAVLEDCVKTECRVLASIAASKELQRHSYLFVGAIVDCVSGIRSPRAVRELLLPGVFALLDACAPRQRKAVSAVLSPLGKVCLAQMNEWYLEDFKFKGSA